MEVRVSLCRRLVTALLAASISAAVVAQTSTPPPAARGMATKTDQKSAAPTTSYRSVFDDYVAPGEDKLVSWRDANALVKEIGGWRVYARESQQPTPANTVMPAGRSPAPREKP